MTNRSYRVLRGGSWYSDAQNLRSGFRSSYSPGGRDYDFGFRLVRTKDKALKTWHLCAHEDCENRADEEGAFCSAHQKYYELAQKQAPASDVYEKLWNDFVSLQTGDAQAMAKEVERFRNREAAVQELAEFGKEVFKTWDGLNGGYEEGAFGELLEPMERLEKALAKWASIK